MIGEKKVLGQNTVIFMNFLLKKIRVMKNHEQRLKMKQLRNLKV